MRCCLLRKSRDGIFVRSNNDVAVEADIVDSFARRSFQSKVVEMANDCFGGIGVIVA